MTINTWSEVLTLSFKNLWLGVMGFVPNLVVAIVVVLIGWGIGSLFGKVVAQIIKALKIDEALRKAGVEDFLNKGGLGLNSGSFLGGLVRWFVILVFLIGAFEILHLSQVTAFLRDILGYLPQVIVAVLMLIAAGLVADAMKKIVLSSAMTAEVSSAGFLATVTKWVIWIFAIWVAAAKASTRRKELRSIDKMKSLLASYILQDFLDRNRELIESEIASYQLEQSRRALVKAGTPTEGVDHAIEVAERARATGLGGASKSYLSKRRRALREARLRAAVPGGLRQERSPVEGGRTEEP
jgi:hypothetical protein